MFLRRFSSLTLTLVTALAITSCATMSPEECRRANWRDVGLRDGLDGSPLALLAERTSDCAEAKVTVDNVAYLLGRDDGLKTFCRVENALPLGLNGGTYHGVCPPQVDEEFRRRHAIGYNVFFWRNELAQIGSRMQSLEMRLFSVGREEDRRARDGKTDDDRRRIRREADDERRRIRNELRDLDFGLLRAREQLRAAEWALGGVH